MGSIALVIGLFIGLPTVAADSGPTLTTLAAATNRPRECAALLPRAGSRKASVWRLARMPTLGAFCDEIAKADALITTDPKGALAAAQRADAALPDRASASVAIARALLSSGDVRSALEAFDHALALDKRSLDEPKAMNDYARALVLGGKAADAAAYYRALVPRAELLPDSARPLVYLQAAHALMAHAATSGATRGPGSAGVRDAGRSDLADAAAYLAEARSSQTAAMRGDVLYSIALVFDRSGDSDKASIALAEAFRGGATLTDEGKGYAVSPDERLALTALVAEGKGSLAAADAWAKFLQSSPPVSWGDAAKARLSLVKRSNGGKKTEPNKPGRTK